MQTAKSSGHCIQQLATQRQRMISNHLGDKWKLVGGWTNPFGKIWVKVDSSSPIFGVKIKHSWNHQVVGDFENRITFSVRKTFGGRPWPRQTWSDWSGHEISESSHDPPKGPPRLWSLNSRLRDPPHLGDNIMQEINANLLSQKWAIQPKQSLMTDKLISEMKAANPWKTLTMASPLKWNTLLKLAHMRHMWVFPKIVVPPNHPF